VVDNREIAKGQAGPLNAGVGIRAVSSYPTRARHNGGCEVRTCEISAVIATNSDSNEVWVVEIPGDIPPGSRVIGTMHFVEGQCIAKQCEDTIAGVVLMASASTAFAELVAARLRERSDYTRWRQRILATPSPSMLEN